MFRRAGSMHCAVVQRNGSSYRYQYVVYLERIPSPYVAGRALTKFQVTGVTGVVHIERSVRKSCPAMQQCRLSLPLLWASVSIEMSVDI